MIDHEEALEEGAEFDAQQKEAEEQHAPVNPEVEAEARKYGWRPKEEWSGRNPDGWVDAERFLGLPQTHVKMLKDQKQEYETELKKLREEQQRIGGTVKAALEAQRREAEERHRAEIERIRQEQRAAVEAGDVEQWERLQKRADGISPPQRQTGIDHDVLSKHTWLSDPELARAGYFAIESSPVAKMLPPERQIEWARDEVKRFYPDKFQTAEEPKPEEPQRRQRVDGGGLASGAAPKRERGWDELPPAAKQAAKEFFDDGLFGFKEDPATARRKYAQSYWEQGA